MQETPGTSGRGDICNNVLIHASSMLKHASNMLKHTSNVLKHASNMLKQQLVRHASNMLIHASNMLIHGHASKIMLDTFDKPASNMKKHARKLSTYDLYVAFESLHMKSNTRMKVG